MTAPPIGCEWSEAVERLARTEGVVMLVGATDVGKSTLALAAANEAVRLGRRPALLDTDLGQGEIGPPGTLGVVRLEEPTETLSRLKPRALAFVGDTSPPGHFLSVIQGTRRLVRHALERHDDVVFVDTSGLVSGRLAEKLKLAKLEVLHPSLVVVVERGQELRRLTALLANASDAPVLRVQSSPAVKRKSPVFRRIARANRMCRHFEHARRLDLDAGQVLVFDAWLYTGTPLLPRKLAGLSQAMGVQVLHGEETADGIYLCTRAKPNREGYAVLQEEFGRQRVTITPAALFHNLLVGLYAPGGHLVDIGLLQGINFQRALFQILTPARSTSDVNELHFGRLRVRPDGTEIARLRPSDL